VREVLGLTGLVFEQEYRIGRYSIDFYLPETSTALEVDGAYWHRDTQRDSRKAAFLVNHGIKVVRVKEHDIKTLGAIQAVSIALGLNS
jgi:very-short-patch-repair endonuclease